MDSKCNPDIKHIMYGTAWKTHKTAELVEQALNCGFRKIDTAGQPRHYDEKLVGDGIALFLQKSGGNVKRHQLFIQTKFTYLSGQDPSRLPYDQNADYRSQVIQSFENSCRNLQTDYLDSYLLHGPYKRTGISDVDWIVWRTMEELYKAKKILHLGISNVNISQLIELYDGATVKPTFVQNRCYAVTQWDHPIRRYCIDKNITYQGFSLLTANSFALSHKSVINVARRLDIEPEQVVFCFAKQIGMLPLTGTTNVTHMKADLSAIAVCGNSLTADEIAGIETCGNNERQ